MTAANVIWFTCENGKESCGARTQLIQSACGWKEMRQN